MTVTEQAGPAAEAPLLTSATPSVKACCHTGGGVGAGPEAPVVALVGAPNTGKSTLFNALTGSRVTMGNWPGTTVEVSRGIWKTTRDAASCTCEECTCDPSELRLDITLIDLPGAYSIDPHSPDEALTRELLVGVPEDERPDLCVVACDASRLANSLYLVAQLRERGLPMIVALTMLDVAAKSGITVDVAALSRGAGLPGRRHRSRVAAPGSRPWPRPSATTSDGPRPPRPVPDDHRLPRARRRPVQLDRRRRPRRHLRPGRAAADLLRQGRPLGDGARARAR